MSEVIKRDKQARLLAALYNEIKTDRKKATEAMVAAWQAELTNIWQNFQKRHDEVLDRAGSTEMDEQHKLFDQANSIQRKVSLALIELRAEYPSGQRESQNAAAIVSTQLELKYDAMVKRLESACQDVHVADAETTFLELSLGRTAIEQGYSAVQELGMERIAHGGDQVAILAQEATLKVKYMAALLVIESKRPPPPAAAEHDGDKLRIPQLHITPFDGRLDKWEAFHESFTQGIHLRCNLPGVQKLQYLKGVLRGPPEALIQNFGLSDANYEAAWALLKSRYNNVRALVVAHMRVLTTLQKCGKSAEDLRRVSDSTASALLALRNLGRPVDSWDDWVVYHVCETLDTETRQLWEQDHSTGDEMPTWGELDEFIQGRIRALTSFGAQKQDVRENRAQNKSNKVRAHTTSTNQQQNEGSAGSNSRQARKCAFCGEDHIHYHCQTFHGMNIQERRRVVAEKLLCFVCLRVGHRAQQCTSNYTCQICQQRHNTMLHELNAAAGDQQVASNTATFATDGVGLRPQVLLATAIVTVRDNLGQLQSLRALLDQGSEASFISEDAARSLQLPTRCEKIDIVGLSGVAAARSKQSMMVCVNDRHGHGFSVDVRALIIPRVSRQLEKVAVAGENHWPQLSKLLMADPYYYATKKIDILLGSDVYGKLLMPGLRQCAGMPTAQNSHLGWILSGPVPSQGTQTITTHHATVDDQLAKFWEIEESNLKRRMTIEEEKCEAMYEKHVSRDSSGRLHVRIPMKHEKIEFGESQRFAVQRQLQIERKFKARPEFASQYRQFMAEYIELGHMCEVVGGIVDMTCSQAMLSSTRREYYIPHHAVMKEASTTTKLRVVFDASRRTTNGVSLNDEMMIGPRIQEDLTAILMQWRKFRVAFSADVAKMYRQIMIDEPDADLQRIVWRSNADEKMKVYQLRTVTYGTASAPYLAVKSLQTLARLEEHRYPVGAKIALTNFYVDDLLGGADSEKECIESQQEVIALLSSGGLELRKWASNNENVLAQVSPEQRECQLPLSIKDEDNISTLGLQWNPGHDQLGFKIEKPDDVMRWTKRSFLSAASRLYDPMGWLAPSIILVKVLFQSLWKRNLEWDDELPHDLAQEWMKIYTSLPLLGEIRISRWIGTTNDCNVELHGFCDASLVAYAAVVYLRVIANNSTPHISNLCAKTKVAPIKVLSLPRLELCGATLLVKLVTEVQNSLQLPNSRITCWTDSTIVLAWLSGHPSRFNVFVANRSSEIQRKLPQATWRHVASSENPADCASRGIPPHELQSHHLWWTGPKWLREIDRAWPLERTISETTEETRVCANTTSVTSTCWELIMMFSSWRKLARVTALCRRFIKNCRQQKSSRSCGPLTPIELAEAREYWVRAAQEVAFKDELQDLRKNRPIKKSSSLRALNPTCDGKNVLRVDGRLKNAYTISATARNPAIVPRRSALSALLIADAHEQTLHGGAMLTLAFLRREYWIIDGPNEIRRFVMACTVCYRYRARPCHQIMAPLPAARVVPSRAFKHCAMDFSGAIMVRGTRGRGHHATKSYVVVFVCLATKAVHIELAGDLTTRGFIAAYERFTARRGCCTDLYSDNATNFVGAAAVFLRSERQLFDVKVQEALADKGTIWHFSPPLSPHFNGLAESAIRSVKHHIRRVVGESTLTFEELSTVLAKVEACLNSRPLCPMTNNIDDFDVLTPAHFLIGEPTKTLPQPSVLESKTSALTRWQLTHQMLQRIWKKWSVEYLHTLQQRRKWQSATDNLEVGDMVLVIEDNMPPAKWALGRIIEVHPGDDGKVRVVTIRTRGSTYKRAVVKVAKLPIHDNNTNPCEQSN